MTVTAGLSNYLENAVLNWFRGTAFPAVPTHIYLALFTTAPTNGSDSSAVEVPSSNGYVRLQLTPNTTNFGAPSGAAPATSVSGANFVMATPTGAGWGTVVAMGFYDAATAGNFLGYAPVTPTAIGSGDTVEFLTGNCTLSVS